MNNLVAEEADYVKLYCQMPPIAKMDGALIGLKNCEYEPYIVMFGRAFN